VAKERTQGSQKKEKTRAGKKGGGGRKGPDPPTRLTRSLTRPDFRSPRQRLKKKGMGGAERMTSWRTHNPDPVQKKKRRVMERKKKRGGTPV